MIDLDKLKRTINFAAAVAVDAGQQNLANNLDECVHQIELIEKRAIAAEASVDELVSSLEMANSTTEKLLVERDQLKSKLADIEKQEPEVWQYKSSFNRWKCFENEKHHKDTIADGSFEVRPLYAKPVQQSTAVAVNELIECIKYLMEWQVKNVDKWHNDAYDQAAKLIAKLNKQGA